VVEARAGSRFVESLGHGAGDIGLLKPNLLRAHARACGAAPLRPVVAPWVAPARQIWAPASTKHGILQNPAVGTVKKQRFFSEPCGEFAPFCQLEIYTGVMPPEIHPSCYKKAWQAVPWDL
jgi:hypothetical protein